MSIVIYFGIIHQFVTIEFYFIHESKNLIKIQEMRKEGVENSNEKNRE